MRIFAVSHNTYVPMLLYLGNISSVSYRYVIFYIICMASLDQYCD